ncbi:MAG: uroporphyrinogen-III C-methyltransferase [Burkholderiaceae bacterium]|jgi:uroporphyrin-3 C-methyltransferase|nr:uroporphyrinogen-III C-methyltransferase [Burkholderiaceae bacterium]MEB2320205.1 uroporphyrinogen-III C-methyltransferase [Pseudomonadota bacterium]
MSEVTPQPPGSGGRSDPAGAPAGGAATGSKPPANPAAGDPKTAPKPGPKGGADVDAGDGSKAKGATVSGSGPGSKSGSAPKPPAPAASKPPAPPKPAGRGALWLALLALVAAIAGPLLLWQWSQKNIQELARRVQDSDSRSAGASQQANQAIDQVRELRSRTEGTEARLAEAAGQQAQLEKLYRSVALDGADALLAELESALSLAAQQLASGGSAEGALLALQSADGRLGRLDDPALVGVRRAIGRDIERLRNATGGDVGVLAARLDTLARSVDDWPLAADSLAIAPPAGRTSVPAATDAAPAAPQAAVASPSTGSAGPSAEPAAAGAETSDAPAADGTDAGDGAATPAAAADDSASASADSTGSNGSVGANGPAADGGATDGAASSVGRESAGDAPAGAGGSSSFIERLGGLIRVDRMIEELSSLFRVRRVDAPDAALIAPDQAYFLRENLRLRLLNARLALLSRNDPLFRSDIEQAVKWIERYFDRSAPEVGRALAQLEQLARARTAGEAPSVNDSLGAVRAARAAREARQ